MIDTTGAETELSNEVSTGAEGVIRSKEDDELSGVNGDSSGSGDLQGEKSKEGDADLPASSYDGLSNRDSESNRPVGAGTVETSKELIELSGVSEVFALRRRGDGDGAAQTPSSSPMNLPTFKPAEGCMDSSEFITRCFVARLRAGITVLKHGRSRWCKSRLRTLLIHPDGRSLTWLPAEGEPVTSKRQPRFDLSSCVEVRHAWSPDPDNTMYTGTPVLRRKCEVADAPKSFALIFPRRTVDITALTTDQCKVLLDGFSALCYHLHAAASGDKRKKSASSVKSGDDDICSTASVTLTTCSKVG